MDTKHTDRRTFLKSSLSTAAIAAAPLVLTAAPRRGSAQEPLRRKKNRAPSRGSASPRSASTTATSAARSDAVIRGGGELVSFYAEEATSRPPTQALPAGEARAGASGRSSRTARSSSW